MLAQKRRLLGRVEGAGVEQGAVLCAPGSTRRDVAAGLREGLTIQFSFELSWVCFKSWTRRIGEKRKERENERAWQEGGYRNTCGAMRGGYTVQCK